MCDSVEGTEWFQNLGIFTLDELLEIDKKTNKSVFHWRRMKFRHGIIKRLRGNKKVDHQYFIPTLIIIMLNFIRHQQKADLLKKSFRKFSANGLSSAYTWVGEVLTANKAAGAMMFTGSVLYGLVRADIYSFKTDLRGEMSASEARLKADMSASEMRMKADMDVMKADIKGDMSASEMRMKADIITMKADIKGDMSASEARVKADLKASEDRVMAKIEEVFSKK